SNRLACPPAPALHTTRLPCPNRPEIDCPARRGRRRRAARTAVYVLWLVSPSSSPTRSWSQTCAPLECPTPCASGQSLAQTTLGARTVRHPPRPQPHSRIGIGQAGVHPTHIHLAHPAVILARGSRVVSACLLIRTFVQYQRAALGQGGSR